MKRIKCKVGTEIEAWVFSKRDVSDGIFSSNSQQFPSMLIDEFKKVYKRKAKSEAKKYLFYPSLEYDDSIHWDGATTEVAFKPSKNMEEYYEILSGGISLIYDLCKRKGWYYLHSGCTPCSGSGAGAHTHISGLPVNTMFYKLWTYQPFIGLLSQNSPMNSRGLSDVTKDTRLLNSSWATYTSSLGEGSALSADRKGSGYRTVEVRIPSDTTLIHMVGIASFIKACLLVNDNFKFNDNTNNSLYNSVKARGTDASLTVKLTDTVKLLGFKIRYVPIPINVLFSILIKYGELHEALHMVLSELPSGIRGKVIKFYELISDGYTFSDYIFDYFSAWFKRNYPKFDYTNYNTDYTSSTRILNVKKDVNKEFIKLMHTIGRRSYQRNIPFWEQLPKPVNNRFTERELISRINKSSSSSFTLSKLSIKDNILRCIESDSQYRRTWTKK